MKKFYLLTVLMLLCISAFCTPAYIYTAVKTGSWNDLSVWAITTRTDGVPQTKVVIPSPYTITVTNAVNSFGLGDVEIKIGGTLDVLGNTQINLSIASSVELQGTGKITGNTNTQKMVIGAVTKYDGSKDFIKTGASIANVSTGSSPFGFSLLTALPVKLLSFTAEKAVSAVILKWTTSAEINNAFFDVERSNDGASWTAIARINGAGSTQIASDYQYTDINPTAAVSYYRLKQTDRDGLSEVSVVKTVAAAIAGTAKIYAADKNVYIRLAEDIKTTLNVTVLTMSGRPVLTAKYSAGKAIEINLAGRSLDHDMLVVNINDGHGTNQSSKILL